MLLELSVQNLLLIEEARLELAGGLNVITGETGAGKTVLAHALDLLLGGRARPGIVRPGAGEAYVEGVFELPAERPERLPADAEELVLARRVAAFLKREDGPTAVEYAVMLALIVVVCIVSITALGTNANKVFSNVALNTAVAS